MKLDDLHASLRLASERRKFEAWRYFKPVPKQMEFFALGKTKTERMLMAGNGCGKTLAAAFEVTCHMIGEYPDWWPGYRVDKPMRVWAGGTSSKMVREGSQTKLLGPPGEHEMLGTAMIPRSSFVGIPTSARGAIDSVDSFSVRHSSGGISRLVFKTYEQDRKDWQGADIDILWDDEEPPLSIYTEGVARLRGRGNSMMTFTPLLGMSEVVCRFLEEETPDRGYIKVGIRDALFYTDTERDRMVAGYPSNEREARANGDPLLGSGKIFTTPEADIREAPLRDVPLHWRKIWGLDFGIDHPFAAVLYALDPDTDTVHILHSIRMTTLATDLEAPPLRHATAMRKVAANVPVAWPFDGHARDKGSGDALAKLYRAQSLAMLASHATHPSGGYSTYAGILDLDAYMKGGRFRVNETLSDWFSEYGRYHYKDGQIVKIRDDLMSATRVAHMSRRFAKDVPLGGKTAMRRGMRFADGADGFYFGID